MFCQISADFVDFGWDRPGSKFQWFKRHIQFWVRGVSGFEQIICLIRYHCSCTINQTDAGDGLEGGEKASQEMFLHPRRMRWKCKGDPTIQVMWNQSQSGKRRGEWHWMNILCIKHVRAASEPIQLGGSKRNEGFVRECFGAFVANLLGRFPLFLGNSQQSPIRFHALGGARGFAPQRFPVQSSRFRFGAGAADKIRLVSCLSSSV